MAEKPAGGLLAPPGGAGGQALTDAVSIGSQGGGGEAGAVGVGQNTDVAGGPANIGLSFNVGPGSVNVGPTGTISVGGARGDSTTQGIGQALTAALNLAGIPTSINVPSLIASLTSAPALGIAAQLAGAFGAPFTLVSLAHGLASMSPTSVTSLQALLADPNPEAQLTAAQAIAIAAGGQMGPTVGGPQAPSPTRGYAIDPNQLPQGNREDIGIPDNPTVTDPATQGAIADATAGTGVSSSTGAEGAAPSDGAPGGSGDSPAM